MDPSIVLRSLGAGWVLWLLLGLSVIALAVVLERSILFAASRDDVPKLREELRRLLDRGELPAARRRLEGSRSFEARVACAGLEADGAAAAEERMNGEAELVRAAMERRLGFLGTVGNNAPFVGLLGTVIGIVRAFDELDQSRGQISSGLMTEIGEALVATALGLCVALPAVACFNAFQALIRSRLANASALCHEVLAHLKSGRAASPAE